MPLIPALGGRGRRISEFEASLVYRASSRAARATQRNPVSKTERRWEKQQQLLPRQTCLALRDVRVQWAHAS